MMFSKIFSAAAAIGALVLAAAPCGAQEMRETVRFATSDLATPAGRQAILTKIDHATARVCGQDYDVYDLQDHSELEACQRESMARAVRAIGRPELAQSLQERVGGPVVKVAEGSSPAQP